MESSPPLPSPAGPSANGDEPSIEQLADAADKRIDNDAPLDSATLFAHSVLLGTVYLALSIFSRGSFFPDSFQQVIWPTSGLAVAILAGTPKQRWSMYIGAMAIADFICNILEWPSFWQLWLPLTCLSMLEPLVSAWILQSYSQGVFRLSTIRRLMELIIYGAILVPLASALLGSFLLATVVQLETFSVAFNVWWNSNCAGVMAVSPMILSWMDRKVDWREYFAKRYSIVEFICWQIISIMFAFLVFGPKQDNFLENFQFPIFIIPLFFCISLRFGLRGISTSLMIFIFPAIYGTADGHGFVASNYESSDDQMWAIQRFVAVISGTMSVLSILQDQQKRSIRLVYEQSQLLRSIINSTSNAVLVKDLQGRYLHANQSAANLLGSTIEKVIGSTSEKFLPPENLEQVLSINNQVATSGTAREIEMLMTVTDKQQIIKAQVTPLRDGFDEIAGVIIFAQDVTEERKGQQRLTESERRFRTYAASSPVGMFELNKEGTCIFANHRLQEITQLSEEEMMAGGIVTRIHPEDLEGVIETWRQFHNTDRDWVELSYRLLYSDGKIIDLIVPTTALRDANRAITGYIGSAVDVSFQKEAERDLFASRERFRILAEDAPIGIFEIDMHAICTFVNQEWSTITGRTREQGQGLGWVDSVHPEDIDQFRQSLLKTLQERRDEFYIETRLLRPNGSIAWAVGRLSSIRADRKSITGYIGTLTDITSQIEARLSLEESNELLEQRVRQRTSELEHANNLLNTEMIERAKAEDRLRTKQAALAHVLRVSTLGELATELAHELNQPLHAISTYAGGLLTRANRTELTSKTILPPLQQIAHEAERAAELVRRTRSFAVRRETHFQSMNVADAIKEAVGLIAFEARQRSIAVELHLPQILPNVMADSLQIQQVLVNLIRNAFDAVSAAEAMEPRVIVSAVSRHSVVVTQVPQPEPPPDPDSGAFFDDCSHIEIQVRDFGTGLTSELLEKVFDAFISTKTDGLGLGLTISRSIADAHHGRLTAENHPQGGALFRFLIPYSETAANES